MKDIIIKHLTPEFVEGYPSIIFNNNIDDFTGPIAMFNKLGFVEIKTVDKILIVRKKL